MHTAIQRLDCLQNHCDFVEIPSLAENANYTL